MTNVTLSINEDDLKQARLQALQDGTSLNSIIRDFVKSYIGQTKRYQQVTSRLLQHAESSTFELGNKTWTRDELYER